jgi:4,5-DOPA dioxygenase extradiol
MSLFPALFIGHGSPMNIIEDNDYTRHLKKLAGKFPRPKAIIVISAHWLTNGTSVTGDKNPVQIYDFYGFPQKLYEIQYKPSGIPELAEQIVESGKEKRLQNSLRWGIDHAAWSVLVHIFPKADIPVLEISTDLNTSPVYQYELGKLLQKLREKEILIIGSGNLIHNLFEIDYNMDASPYDWAVEADETIKQLLIKEDLEGLFSFPKKDLLGYKSVPSADHYYPMLCIMGTKQPEEKITFTFEGIQNGSISMRSFIIN